MINCEILQNIIESKDFKDVRVVVMDGNGNEFTSVFGNDEVFWFGDGVVDMEHEQTHLQLQLNENTELDYDEVYKSFEIHNEDNHIMMMF